MGSEERYLIEAAQRDPTHFAELYEEHFPRIYAYIAKRIHERDAAQDLTAEVFQSALANLQGYEWRGVPFAAWLYRIAANAVADHWKKVSRPSASGWVIAREESDAIERRATLFRLVDRLPGNQRRVVIMRFAEGRSIREVARQIGRSEGAVKQLQWRALQKLRAEIRPSECGGLPPPL